MKIIFIILLLFFTNCSPPGKNQKTQPSFNPPTRRPVYDSNKDIRAMKEQEPIFTNIGEINHAYNKEPITKVTLPLQQRRLDSVNKTIIGCQKKFL